MQCANIQIKLLDIVKCDKISRLSEVHGTQFKSIKTSL